MKNDKPAKLHSARTGKAEIQSWIDRINKDPNSFGVTKYIGLIWSQLQKINPVQWLINRAQKHSYKCGKIAVEAYVFFKLAITLILFLSINTSRWWAITIAAIFAWNTFFYPFGIIYATDAHIGLHSAKRSIILLLLNYLQLNVFFAFIYNSTQIVENVDSHIEALYFSVVTSTTLGYGDYSPKECWGQLTVIIHVSIMVIFTLLYIGFFLSQIGNRSEKRNQP